MDDRVPRLRIGPYLLMRQMDRGRWTDRWLAVHDREDSAHVVHRFAVGAGEHQRFLEAAERASRLDHPHLLPIEHFTLGTVVGGNAWVVTPYTGTQDGLLTLDGLLSAKGGRMPPPEAERALVQLLGACRYAHVLGVRHGPVSMDEVLVDRRGSVAVELYGLGRELGPVGPGVASAAEVVRDEVRSVVEIGYQLVTGLSADEPRIDAGRLVRRLDARWDGWFEAGLDLLGGFADADAAIAALPSTLREVASEVKLSPVRTVLTRFRRALRAN
jgi:hypothetical protein